MKRLRNILLITSFFIGGYSICQNIDLINSKVKISLDSIIEKDSTNRILILEMITQLNSNEQNNPNDSLVRKLILDSIQNVLTTQEIIDFSNIVFIDSLIKIYGYPGLTLVGTPTNEYAWYIIQHSDKIDSYLKIIKQAGKQHEIPMYLVAKMIDRSKLQKGKKQIFGTQGKTILTNDSNVTSFIWPIRNPRNVNKRRSKAGFKLSIEQHCQELLNTEYKVVKLRDVK